MARDTLDTKTIVFHSYKGGVGRTSALMNTALGLLKLGKSVGIVDMDFDAPGVALKVGYEKKVEGGYVDYLLQFSASERSRHLERGSLDIHLVDYMRDRLIELEYKNIGTIALLPSGNVFDPNYFTKVNSPELLSKFEVKVASGGHISHSSMPKSFENWFGLKCDKDVILKAMGGVDYLLVDCRSAHQFASATNLAWADKVLEIFPCNSEGFFGHFLINGFVYENEVKLERNIEYYPLVSRVPPESHGMISKTFSEMKTRFHNHFGAFIDETTVPTLCLSEQRQIETGNGVFFSNGNDALSGYNISYEYAELISTIAPECFAGLESADKKLPVNSSQAKALGLNESKRRWEKIFDYVAFDGTLLNTDNHENVALRRSTAASLVNSIAEQQNMALQQTKHLENMKAALSDESIRKDLVRSGFRQAGLSAGQGFGKTAKQVWKGNPPEEIEDRLVGWCNFDREVGFGDWVLTYCEKSRRGEFLIKNHFLMTAATMGDHFIIGYIEGVVSFLGSDDLVETKIDVSDAYVSMDQLEPTTATEMMPERESPEDPDPTQHAYLKVTFTIGSQNE